jgi:hypothetical protein
MIEGGMVRRRGALATVGVVVGFSHLGCTITPTCDACRRFDATEWCTGAGAGQCTSSGPSCAPDAGAPSPSCFPQRFEATSQRQSLTLPVGAFKSDVAGLTVVDVHLNGTGPLDITPSTGTTQFGMAFDGMPVTCTLYTSDATQVYLRCPAPSDLAVIEVVIKQTSTAFTLSVTFSEPACGTPLNPCKQ